MVSPTCIDSMASLYACSDGCLGLSHYGCVYQEKPVALLERDCIHCSYNLLIATFLDSYVGISQNSSKTPNLLMTLDFIGFSKVHDLKSKDIYKLNRGQSQIPRHSPCIFARKRLFAA